MAPPAKLIYDPVKGNTAQDLEGWISGPSAATVFHDYQAKPDGIIKHLILPHFPVCLCLGLFHTLSVVGQNLKHFQKVVFFPDPKLAPCHKVNDCTNH